MKKISKYGKMVACMVLVLILCVGATLGITLTFFGDVQSGSAEIKLGASIMFKSDGGVAVTTESGISVVPSQTVNVQTTLTVVAGEGDVTKGVLKVIPSFEAGVTGAKLTLQEGESYSVKIDNAVSSDAVIVVHDGSLYLAESANTANLKVFSPTTSGTAISFTVPVTFPDTLGNSVSGQKCSVTMKGIVIQSTIYDNNNNIVPTTIVKFQPYLNQLANVYTVVVEDGKEYIEMGEYPQTIKASSVTIQSTTPDANGYYTGSDGERYAKVTYEPSGMLGWNGFTSSSMATYKLNQASDGTMMQDGTDYYFKVEPIKWHILRNNDGTAFIASDVILDSMKYQEYYSQSGDYYYALDISTWSYIQDNGSQVFANNYKWSSLRSFFNNDFYSKAFSSEQKSLVRLTEVNNSASTTASNSNTYACANTNDYVFALSYNDVTNTEYGFNSNASTVDTARVWKTTDYAKAKGAFTYTQEYINDSTVAGSGAFWLRSPSSGNSERASNIYRGCVADDTFIISTTSVKHIGMGIVPALNFAF